MVKVIAEVGTNWDPIHPVKSWQEAIMAAKDAGADFVKGQDFHPIEDMRRPQEWKDRCSPWTLTPLLIEQIQGMCEEWEIPFFASAFTKEAITRANHLGYPILKLASSEIRNRALLVAAWQQRWNSKLLISLGEAETWDLLEMAAFLSRTDGSLSAAFMMCVAEYPASKEKALRQVCAPHPATSIIWGWSSHVSYPDAIDVAVLAAERGARYIEVHMQLENTPKECPDNGPWSLYPNELAELCKAVKDV